MKTFLLSIVSIICLSSCSSSKKLFYDFGSVNVADSVVNKLKKFESVHNGNYERVKWFALIRQDAGFYELIITENTGGKNFPFSTLINKTNRFLKIDHLLIPVIFDIDFLSDDFRKITTGTVNFGGYYFKIGKENDEYKVLRTGVLF